MAYPRNAGPPAHPNYDGNIIPYVWARKLLERFYDASVLPYISQTDYEGEIRDKGSKVYINQVPDIEIRDYSMGDSLILQRPEQEKIELDIDQGKYWSFIMDDVADAQAMTNMMGPWSENASERMKITVDTDVLAYLFDQADADNQGATAGRISQNIDLGTTGAAIAVSSSNVISHIVDHGQALDEQNIPESSRKLVIPAWMAARLKKSDLKDASITGDGTSVMRNGRLGMIDRYELYVSNLLPRATDGGNICTYIYSIHPKALTFASQLVKTETLRAESTFGNIMRGLKVYGRKVVLPEAYTIGYVRPA